ncbi:GroES-like protein [Lophiostoma macrostomum CBS 122681]|uniref:D-xylulose reductase n=1 Tax=Lophiostoma macrostomum CBS 122681 TaxID=1314788 RepID=A0A6A6TSE6_9PLEO|nr:GroES-like protein [Lophiostoma macrostomum CBS 122681]
MSSSTRIENMQNPSLLLYGPKSAKYEDRPIPELGNHDVLVRIAYVGVCGSDVHFWNEGGFTKKVSTSSPITMGHETSGTIHSIGPLVSTVKPGDRVAVEPGVPCRYCKPCKAGSYHFCKDMRFAAAPPDGHGALTKFFRSAEDFVYKIPEKVGLDEAVLVEPLAVGVHATRLVDVRPGEKVVVMGSGTVGLMCAAVSKVFGAESVVIVDILEKKLEFARGWFGCETFKAEMGSSAEENSESLLEKFGLEDDGVDVVIEASGAASSIETGIHLLRRGGKYVQTGLGKPKIEFPIVALSEKELMVRGCFRYGPGDFELATSLIARGIIDAKALISSTRPFEEAVSAWEATGRGEGIKNLIKGVED